MTKTRVIGLAVFLAFVATKAMASVAVPELDPGSASTAVTILVGGLLAFSGRRRKR